MIMGLIRAFAVLAVFSFACGDAGAADLKYRIRKRICEMYDTCPTTSGSSSSSGGSGGGDTTPPTASGFSPADEAADVWTTANLVITFDEDIGKGASGNIIIMDSVGGGEVETIAVGAANVTLNGAIATINPASDLAAGSYYVTVDAGTFTDTAGNPFVGIAGSSTWNFAVAAGVPASFQDFATHQALDWEAFVMNGETYLAIANGYNDVTYSLNSKIYKFNSGTAQFEDFQAIPTVQAVDWNFFTIGGEPYLAVSNYMGGGVKVYKFNPGTTQFDEFRSIVIGYPFDSETFVIDGETYFAVANAYPYNTTSKIYRFSPDTLQFVEIQAISTSGAYSMESFVIDGETYLAVANDYDGSTYNLNSRVYKFDSGTGQFSEFQSIPTNGARDFESFVIDGEMYLAVVNSYNGSSVNINSRIYKFNSGTEQFSEFQSIPTNGAFDWESFTAGGNAYLAVANSSNGSTYNINSKVYRFDLAAGQFVEVQNFPTNSAADWEFFTAGGEEFLVVGNGYNGSSYNNISKIYRFYR